MHILACSKALSSVVGHVWMVCSCHTSGDMLLQYAAQLQGLPNKLVVLHPCNCADWLQLPDFEGQQGRVRYRREQQCNYAYCIIHNIFPYRMLKQGVSKGLVQLDPTT